MDTDAGFVHPLDRVRKSFNGSINRADRSKIGQFLTPVAIAGFMSSLFETIPRQVRILDPGAGTGVLFAACVEAMIAKTERPESIEVVAYETDNAVMPYLEETMEKCRSLCASGGIDFHGIIKADDFVSTVAAEIDDPLFSIPEARFTHTILNPPYKKINSRTAMSRMLYSSGIEVSNLYAVFVWLSMLLLEDGGQMVAITPRSFCNGPYFKKFRSAFMGMMALRRVHLFELRNKAFGDDDVLQENVIFHAVRESRRREPVRISVSETLDFDKARVLTIPYSGVIHPGDRDMFVHLDVEEAEICASERMKRFGSSLSDLQLSVSTGRVVDFRAREHLRQMPEVDTVPLIYPCHFSNGFITWPAEAGRKPNAIRMTEETSDLLVETGFYVLTKRFSSKEQRRRVMAAVFDPTRVNASFVGFENHLNYYHRDGKGLPPDLAKGLALYLNSTMVDRYFRLFSGHTQVNAADLRKMPYPAYEQLLSLGRAIDEGMPDQKIIDAIMEKECPDHAT